MNTLAELALKVAKEMFGYEHPEYVTFAHRLVAELSKQEPVAWRCSSPPCKCDESNYKRCGYANYADPAGRITELEKENAALKDSNEYAWRNARTIDAARMKAEAERDAAIKEVGKWSKEAGLAQSRIEQLRGTLEYVRQEFRKGNGICDEIFDEVLADNTAELDALVKDAEKWRAQENRKDEFNRESI